MEKSGWLGSNIHDDHVDFLRVTRRLRRSDNVGVCIPPELEISPRPEPGEYVLFRAHFLCGVALPASGFFREFLHFYRLQPHHLTPYTVVCLSSFVILCEGYLGVLLMIQL